MKLTLKLVLNIIFVTVLIVAMSTMLLWQRQKELLMEQAHIQAKTLFKMIIITRQWVAENRDDVRPVPAVVTKELSRYADVMSSFRFSITSNVLINPDNAPDDFELRALSKFSDGLKEYDEIVKEGKKNVYRFMAPLYINQACLECHIYQGYNVGDLRGGISVSIPLDEIEASIAKNNMFFYFAGIISFLGIVITITVLLRSFVLNKLAVLAQAASNYKSGDFSEKLVLNTNDEIEELAEAFNLMRESILKNEEHLKNRLQDVTGKYIMLVEELKTKNEELQSVNSFKTEILDSVSHEIRTPLTKIMSYSELLQNPEMDKNAEIRLKSADIIRRSSKSLNRMFNEIIMLSRLDHKQHDYLFTEVPLKSVVEETLSSFENDIKDKKISVECSVEEDIVVSVDVDVFKYLIDNLISNAVKFNRQDGKIVISGYRKDGSVILSVFDTGCGIPQSEIDCVHKRFYRASNVKKDFQGTGLGLSIVNRVVQAHNGKLEIESELNDFTEFRVLLPEIIINSEKY